MLTCQLLLLRGCDSLYQLVQVLGGEPRVVFPPDVILEGVLARVEIAAQFAAELDLKRGKVKEK